VLDDLPSDVAVALGDGELAAGWTAIDPETLTLTVRLARMPHPGTDRPPARWTLAGPGDVGPVVLDAAGDGYVVAWYDGTRTVVGRLGTDEGPPVRLADAPGFPVAARAIGGEIGLLGWDEAAGLVFRRFAADGAPVAAPLPLGSVGYVPRGALTSDGATYALAWLDGDATVHFATVPVAAPDGFATHIEAGWLEEPELDVVSMGRGFGLLISPIGPEMHSVFGYRFAPGTRDWPEEVVLYRTIAFHGRAAPVDGGLVAAAIRVDPASRARPVVVQRFDDTLAADGPLFVAGESSWSASLSLAARGDLAAVAWGSTDSGPLRVRMLRWCP
jgi:hypothetical protein